MTHHHTDHGETTQDILALGQTHPAETGLHPDLREHRTIRFGRICLITGLTLFPATLLTAITVALLTEGATFTNKAGQMFAMFGLVTAMSAGTILTALGAWERLHRGGRALIRNDILANRHRDHRLDLIEAHLTAIAEHLPDALNHANWKGFTAAVEQGFLEDTGTHPTPHPRRHLSVADPNAITRPRPPS